MKQNPMRLTGGVYGRKAVSLGDFDEFLDWLVTGEAQSGAPQDLYEAVVWTFWCVNLRADNIAQVPYKVYPMDQEDDEEGTEIDFGIDLAQILWQTEAWLCLKAAAYIHKLYNRRKLERIRVLNANSMRVKSWDDWGPLSFEQRRGQERRTYQADEIVYFRTFNAKDDIREGTSSGAVGSASASLIYNSNAWAAAYFANGAIPAVLLTTDGVVSPKEKKNVENKWRQMFQGVRKAFSTAVLEQGMKPTIVGQPLRSLAMPQLEKIQREQILGAHKIPPGLAEAKTNKAERKALQEELWTHCLIPEINVWIKPVLDQQLFNPHGLRISFDYSTIEVLQAAELEKAQGMSFVIDSVILAAYRENVVSVSEARAWIDYVGRTAGMPALDVSFAPEERMPLQLTAGNEEEDDEKALGIALGQWERKALSRYKEGAPSRALIFASDAIPKPTHDMIVHCLELAVTLGDVHEVFKAAAGKNDSKTVLVPEGREEPLPPVPDEVIISEADIDRAIKSWDRLMPEFSNLLEAEVTQRENYDESETQ